MLGEDGITTLSASEDSNMYLNTLTSGEFDEVELNLPSLKRLENAVRLINEEDFFFTLKNNHLEYKGSDIKFKYHLHEDGVINKPKVSLNKLISFKYETKFSLTQEFLSNILKNSSIVEQDKLYLYTEDNKIQWRIGDDQKTNSDTLIITMDEEVDFEMDDTFIINIDNMKNISDLSGSELIFELNSIGVGRISCVKNGVQLKYFFTSLVK
jgi:hypothetical protein